MVTKEQNKDSLYLVTADTTLENLPCSHIGYLNIHARDT